VVVALLGSKKSARKVPLPIRTTNAYSAISPSRNDQWSGKALRPSSLTKPARLVRSLT